MQCPRDGRALTHETYEGDVVVDRYTTCAGIWLDPGELKDVQETIEHDYAHQLKWIDLVAGTYALARQKLQPDIDCPKSGRAVHAREYLFCSQILVDRCACGGSTRVNCRRWRGSLKRIELNRPVKNPRRKQPVYRMDFLPACENSKAEWRSYLCDRRAIRRGCRWARNCLPVR